MLTYLLFVVGLAAVLAGAHFLVLGAARLSVRSGIPAIVTGLTVVGFGTAMPELAVGAAASWDGHPDTAIGNVVGSNIANIALVLGITAVIVPLVPDRSVLRREGLVLVVLGAMVALLGVTGTIEPWMGALFLVVLAGFSAVSVFWARQEPDIVVQQAEHFQREGAIGGPGPLWLSIVYVAVGIAVLAAGGQAVAPAAVDIAGDIGIPEFVLAATVVAIGTSLPELVTSVTAALRREADMAIGTVIGSSIFNLMGVLGVAALINPVPLSQDMQRLDLPWMAGLTLVGVLMARRGYALGRREGAALLVAYVVYVVWLFLR